MATQDIYDREYVRHLFDSMSDSYDRVNIVSSFGFSRRWRRQAVEHLHLSAGMSVGDLMTGAGECWPEIVAHAPGGHIVAVDLSREMVRRAARKAPEAPEHRIDLVQADALEPWYCGMPFDAVVVAFGVKTLGPADGRRLARTVKALLKSGGRFSLIEVSVPKPWLLRVLFLFYIRRVIPLVGRLFLGDPEDYRMLGRYTSRFGDCRRLTHIFQEEGLEASFVSYFFGCATGVVGRRPGTSTGQGSGESDGAPPRRSQQPV